MKLNNVIVFVTQKGQKSLVYKRFPNPGRKGESLLLQKIQQAPVK